MTFIMIIQLFLKETMTTRYTSARHAFRSVLREAGAKAFVQGLGPTMARAFPANAATFFAFEMSMKAMS